MTLTQLSPSLFAEPPPRRELRALPFKPMLQRVPAPPRNEIAGTVTLPIDAETLRALLRGRGGSLEFTVAAETLELTLAYADSQGAHSRRFRGRVKLSFETYGAEPVIVRA